MKYIFTLIISCFFNGCLYSMSSYPYISGDTFRTVAQHIFDERSANFSPKLVKNKDIIFVKSNFIEEFFKKYHPQISQKYILITHNSDASAPGNCAAYLNDPKLIVWFAQNLKNCNHPKIHPLPIGLANARWKHGNTAVVDQTIKNIPALLQKNFVSNLLYMNFSIGTNASVRQKVYNLFRNKDYCYTTISKQFDEYLQEMGHYCFVLCPEGNGIDCHRTWEALYVGCIPIVQTSKLDPLFKNLPVLIVENWEQITKEFLIHGYHKITSKNYNFESLRADYWFKKIRSYQT